MQSEQTAGQSWGKLCYGSFPASKLGHRVWGMETKAAFSLAPLPWWSAMFLSLVCLCLSRGHSCIFPSLYSYQGSEASYSPVHVCLYHPFILRGHLGWAQFNSEQPPPC